MIYLPHRCNRRTTSFLFFFEAMNISAFNFAIVPRINISVFDYFEVNLCRHVTFCLR